MFCLVPGPFHEKIFVSFIILLRGYFTLIAYILAFMCVCLCLCYDIRIYHECEGRIEEFVPRFTIWHHEACRVMPNGDPEGQIFLSYPHKNNRFFFLLTTVFFNFKMSFRKSLIMLRCNFT